MVPLLQLHSWRVWLGLVVAGMAMPGWTWAARAPELTGVRSGKWAHEIPKSLPPDPHVVWGRLDNGFRYALLPHAGVPGRVALQLVVLAGSLPFCAITA